MEHLSRGINQTFPFNNKICHITGSEGMPYIIKEINKPTNGRKRPSREIYWLVHRDLLKLNSK
jgi:hypothetical protein